MREFGKYSLKGELHDNLSIGHFFFAFVLALTRLQLERTKSRYP